MVEPGTPNQEAKGFFARWRWPVIIVAFLGGHVTIMMFAVMFAVGDPSFAVVPDYYEKAVNWDAQRAVERDSDELGWTLDVVPSGFADRDGLRSVVCTLTDAQGNPINDATLSLNFYHRARASHRVTATLTSRKPEGSGNPGGSGRYEALLPMGRAGAWVIEARAQRGGDVFVQTLSRTVEGGVGGAGEAGGASAGGVP